MNRKSIGVAYCRLGFLEARLSKPIDDIREWDKLAREYRALNIRIARMEGVPLIANEFQSDRVIQR